MEDWIYILLGIAWIIYAAYRSSQKQKKKTAAPSQPSYSPQPDQERRPPTFETVFQEILGEGSSLETVFPVEAESYDERTIRELEREKKLYGKPEASLEDIPREEGISAFEFERIKTTFSLSEDEDGDTVPASMEFFPFDIRKAIIYSEILNGPYRPN